jgi:hypothetical protein
MAILLERREQSGSLKVMDADTPSRSIIGHLRGAFATAAKFALDIALPTQCVACREPVDGEGVCAECWAKLSFIAKPYCPRLGIPLSTIPAPSCSRWRRSPIRRRTGGARCRAL